MDEEQTPEWVWDIQLDFCEEECKYLWKVLRNAKPRTDKDIVIHSYMLTRFAEWQK